MKERACLAVKIDKSLLNKARAVVYWTPGLTLPRLITMCLSKVIETLEQENGAPYPECEGKLPSGRHVKWEDD